MDGIIPEEIGQITEVRTIIDGHNLYVSHGERAAEPYDQYVQNR